MLRRFIYVPLALLALALLAGPARAQITYMPPAFGLSGSVSAGCVPKATSATGLACGLATDDGSAFTVAGESFVLSGNISAAAWTTNGIKLRGTPGTLTDTSSSGTVAAAYTNVLGGNTIAASSATTYTDYYSLFLRQPVAGSGATLTNKWSLGTEGGAKFGDSVTLSSGQLLLTPGTVTTSKPPLSITQTVNSGGTTFDIITADITNTASAGIRLLNLKVGGATKGSLSGTGAFQVESRITAGGATGAGNLALASDELAVKLCSNCVVGWSSSATSGGTNDISLTRSAAGVVGIRDGSTGGAAIGFVEQTAPAAPSADGARLFAQDNGAGKTQLCVLFSSGAAQCFATQP